MVVRGSIFEKTIEGDLYLDRHILATKGTPSSDHSPNTLRFAHLHKVSTSPILPPNPTTYILQPPLPPKV